MNFLIGVSCCFILFIRQSVATYLNDDLPKEGIVTRNTQNQHNFGDKIFKLFDIMYATELNTDIPLQKIDNVNFNLSESVDITYEGKNYTVSFENIAVSLSTPVLQNFDCRASEPANVDISLGDQFIAPHYKTTIKFRLKSKETLRVTTATVHIPPKSYGNKGKMNEIHILVLPLTNSYNGKQFKILENIPTTTFACDIDTIKNQYTKLDSLTCSQIENEDIFNFVITNFSAGSSTPYGHDGQANYDFDLGPVEVKSSNKTKLIKFFNYSFFREFKIFAFNVTLRGTYGKNNSQGIYEKIHFEYTVDHFKIFISFISDYKEKIYQRGVFVYPAPAFNEGADVVRDKIIEAVAEELRISLPFSLKNFYDELEN